uniref:Uncharacterized protein n=1 Tax=uncultured bacterium Rlip2 TaxID=581115 RepID=C0K082_9BACT|nr:unknown [uncultured bacterium Rlip2]
MGISAPIRSFVIHNIYPHMHMYSVKKVENASNWKIFSDACRLHKKRASRL